MKPKITLYDIDFKINATLEIDCEKEIIFMNFGFEDEFFKMRCIAPRKELMQFLADTMMQIANNEAANII